LLACDLVLIEYDGQQLEGQAGDSLAIVAVRNGQHPARGGTLCLAGDCGNCVATVDGISWVRTCQTIAAEGTTVHRHPAVGAPTTAGPIGRDNAVVRHSTTAVAIVGRGTTGREQETIARNAGHDVRVFDAIDGTEVVGVFAGPTLIVRHSGDRPGTRTIEHVHAHRLVLATGAAELHPVCPGSRLNGLFTARAAEQLRTVGIDLKRVAVARTGTIAFHGDDHVSAVEHADGTLEPCDNVVVDLGTSPRDILARMAPNVDVDIVGSAAAAHPLPTPPSAGVVCPCSQVSVADLDTVWSKGFRDIELVKRASLCGTGTCQGSACTPHLRAYIAARLGESPRPFTARPAARQLTMGEAAAGAHIETFRRTPLHDEHLALGATLDRFGGWFRPWHYGDVLGEYWAVRNAVSIGDVSTLGKLIVSGPDAVEALERLYPNHVHDIRVGRARYVINLNERGHILDDGMICRDDDSRFTLTFTSGGASTAEMWVRDWVETWGLRVHVLDRTVSHGAINVTGPKAGALLQRLGVASDELPRFLDHRRLMVGGVPCHVMRLSFTGEASFELHHQLDRSVKLWHALLHEGADLGIRPHGLQALFGLRLEKGHIIVGQDTEPDSSPRRVGMEWAVKLTKPAFVGRDALLRTAALPDPRRLFGFTMDGDAPLEGSVIRVHDEVVGHVTSSWRSPVLDRTVLLGWQRKAPHRDEVDIDGRVATVAAAPFFDPEGGRARL
jgi:glycine cleavage system aminomethyltransferase T